MRKIVNDKNVQIALVWLALGIVLFLYYWNYKTTMPSSYFLTALGVLIAGAIGKFYLDRTVQTKFSETPGIAKLMDLLIDAVLVGALIVMFIFMQPTGT